MDRADILVQNRLLSYQTHQSYYRITLVSPFPAPRLASTLVEIFDCRVGVGGWW